MLSRLRVQNAQFLRRSFTNVATAHGVPRMAGKTVVVCGAGNNDGEEWGIGKCTAILLAREGANVVSVSNLKAHAEGTTNVIKGEGNAGLAVTADCTSESEVQRLLKETVQEYGQVDCLINAVS
jgi:NAD(P)-dependent dehydrogenase (short-subunit alcohol dehydrogenase family)